MDALHIAALAIGAEEFITTEKKDKTNVSAHRTSNNIDRNLLAQFLSGNYLEYAPRVEAAART